MRSHKILPFFYHLALFKPLICYTKACAQHNDKTPLFAPHMTVTLWQSDRLRLDSTQSNTPLFSVRLFVHSHRGWQCPHQKDRA